MEPEDPRWRLWLESFRLWVPVIVSLCAISLTVFQAMSTRRHARLSVMPRLDWHVQVDRQGDMTYSLTNVGLGPAVLRKFEFSLDGAMIGEDGPATCAKIDQRLGRGVPIWQTHCFDMQEDLVIRAGDSTVIYASLLAPGATPLAAPIPPDTYLRLRPVVRYCSFYEECFDLR